MEQTTLSIEAVEKEIAFYEDLIAGFEAKWEELKEKTKHLTDRIEVLTAVKAKILGDGAQSITQVNIRSAVDERFSLIPEITKQKAKIEHYAEILDNLRELKSEIK